MGQGAGIMGWHWGSRGSMGGRAAVSDLPPVESAPHRGAPGEAGGGRGGRDPGGPGDAVGGGGGGGQAVGYGAGGREKPMSGSCYNNHLNLQEQHRNCITFSLKR